MSTNKNDGGVVVGLFLMVAAISHAMFSAVSYYEKNTKANENQDLEKVRIVRLLSGWANIGNAAIHVLLVIYTLSNMDNQSEYWLKERELGGIEGPVFLTLLNLSAGIGALRGWTMMYSIGWNAFVAASKFRGVMELRGGYCSILVVSCFM
jgi:hypothetical protein